MSSSLTSRSAVVVGGRRRFVGGGGAGRRRRRWRCPRCRRAAASAARPCSRSPVKSVSTSSVEPTVATATRSAALICSLTYFARRVDRALHVLRLHRADVEQQHDQPASGQRLGRQRRRRAAGRGRAAPAVARRRLRLQPRLDAGQQVAPSRSRPAPCRVISSKVNVCDLLRPAVLAELEVGGGQAAHDRRRRVADDDVDGDELAAAAEDRALLAPGCCGRWRRGAASASDRDSNAEHASEIATRLRRASAMRRTLDGSLIACTQNRNRRLSCAERIGRTESTWPKVGEFTTVSIAGVVHHVEQVGRVHLERDARGCRPAACRARTARSAAGCPGR